MAQTATSKALNKAKSTATKAGSALIKNPMVGIYVIGGVLAVFLGYKIYRAIDSAFAGIETPKDDEDAGGGNVDVINPGQIPVGATINNVQAQTAAAVLLAAMDGFAGVEPAEFNQIKRVFAGRNIQDYVMISKAYGMPRRSIVTGEESTWYLLGEKLNLTQWLTKELNSNQLVELKQIIPGVF